MTTKASARQAMPPSRNANGVEPPLVAATPETLSSIAMPGATTGTQNEIAQGSARGEHGDGNRNCIRESQGAPRERVFARDARARTDLGHGEVPYRAGVTRA